jgi:membrane protein YdbS with pleckstrin-like domain
MTVGGEINASEPPKHNARRARNRALVFWIFEIVVCIGAVEFLLRHSAVSQPIQILIAWVAVFLLNILIDLVIRMKKSWSYLTKTE